MLVGNRYDVHSIEYAVKCSVEDSNKLCVKDKSDFFVLEYDVICI